MINTKNYSKLLLQLGTKSILLLVVLVLVLVVAVSVKFTTTSMLSLLFALVAVAFIFYSTFIRDIFLYDTAVSYDLDNTQIYYDVLNLINFGVIISDDNNNLIFCNSFATAKLGISERKLKTSKITDIVSEADVSKLEELLNNQVETASHTFFIHDKCFVLTTTKKKYMGVVCNVTTLQDVTDVEHNLHTLTNRTDLLEKAIMALPQKITIYDSKGCLVFVNQHIIDKTESFFDTIEFNANMQKLRSAFDLAGNGNTYSTEMILNRGNTEAEDSWAKVLFLPIDLENGETYIECVLNDISAEKLQINTANRELLRLRSLIDNSQNGILFCNANGVISFANKMAADILSVAVEHLGNEFIQLFSAECLPKSDIISIELQKGELIKLQYSRSSNNLEQGISKVLHNIKNFTYTEAVVTFLHASKRKEQTDDDIDSEEQNEATIVKLVFSPIFDSNGKVMCNACELVDVTALHNYVADNKINATYINAILNNFTSGIISIINENMEFVLFGADESIRRSFNIVTTRDVDNSESVMTPTLVEDISELVDLRDNILAAINGAYSQLYGVKILNKVYDLQFHPIPVILDERNVYRCVFVAFDTTSREEYENQMTIQKNFLSKTFADNPIPSVMLDTKGNVLNANKQYCSLIGGDIVDVISTSIFDSSSWLNKEVIITNFGKAIQGKSATFTIFEPRYLGFDNSREDAELSISCSCSPILNMDGKCEIVLISFVCVSENSILLQEIHKTSAINDIVTNNYPNGILMILDSSMYVVLFKGENEIQRQNINIGNILGKDVFSIQNVPLIDVISSDIKSAIADGNKIMRDFDMQIDTGEEKYTTYYDISVIPINSKENNELLYVYICVNNISERKQLENSILEFNSKLEQEVVNRTDQLRETAYDLEVYVNELQDTQEKLLLAQQELAANLDKEVQLNVMKSQFISLMSHEFRTPLTIIQTCVYLLEKYYELQMEDKFEGGVARIMEAVEVMTKLLDNVLFIDEVEEHIPIFHSLDIIDYLNVTISDIVENIRIKQKIVVNTNKKSAHLLSDSKLLKKVIYELLANASKYSKPDTTIYITMEDMEQDFNFSIRDEGNGISDDVVNNVFQRFIRSRDFTNISGAGLGLSIAKSCVDKLKGSIWFDTKKGEGTTFFMTLPKISQEEANALNEIAENASK